MKRKEHLQTNVKKLAIKLLKESKNQSKVARNFDVNRSTISRWNKINKSKKENSLYRKTYKEDISIDTIQRILKKIGII